MRRHISICAIAAGSLLTVALPSSAALTPDDVRGGWIADVNGQRHVYILNVRGTDIRGIYCWDCDNPNNLAFIIDGKLGADSFSFLLSHGTGSGDLFREEVSGTIVDGQLVLATRRQGTRVRPSEMTMMREPRRPRTGAVLPGRIASLPPGSQVQAAAPSAQGAAAPAVQPAGVPPEAGAAVAAPAAAGRGGGRGAAPPGPPEPLTVGKVLGLWLGNPGPNKQYFVFRQVGNEIRGMACGPCDNPFTFGHLDHGVVKGNTFTFDIVHEDWGSSYDNASYYNQATATIAKNEMRLVTQPDNRTPPAGAGGINLIGPIAVQPNRRP